MGSILSKITQTKAIRQQENAVTIFRNNTVKSIMFRSWSSIKIPHAPWTSQSNSIYTCERINLPETNADVLVLVRLYIPVIEFGNVLSVYKDLFYIIWTIYNYYCIVVNARCLLGIWVNVYFVWRTLHGRISGRILFRFYR